MLEITRASDFDSLLAIVDGGCQRDVTESSNYGEFARINVSQVHLDAGLAFNKNQEIDKTKGIQQSRSHQVGVFGNFRLGEAIRLRVLSHPLDDQVCQLLPVRDDAHLQLLLGFVSAFAGQSYRLR